MFLSVNLQFFHTDKKGKKKLFQLEIISISLYVTQCNI